MKLMSGFGDNFVGATMGALQEELFSFCHSLDSRSSNTEINRETVLSSSF